MNRSRGKTVTGIRWFLNVIIAYSLIAIAALVATGGYEFELFGMNLSSNRFDPLLTGLLVGTSLRIGMAIGWANSALLSIALIVAIALAETSLRIIAPPIADPALLQIHRASDTFEFELIPNTKGSGILGEWISINSFGARDDEFGPQQAGRHRMVVLGDSFTFGYGLELEDGYVRRLEARLRDLGHDVEVLNLGVNSYQTWHYIEQLKHRVPLLNPDSVIISFFLDDMIVPAKPTNVEPSNPFAPRIAHKFTASKFWNLIRNVGNKVEFRLRHHRGQEYLRGISERREFITTELAAHYALQTGSISEKQSEQIADAVAEIQAWSQANSVPVLGVYIPDASQVDDPDRQFINRKLAHEFTDKQLDFLDATRAFESHEDPRQLYLFPLDAHTSLIGNELIANSIAEHPAILRLLDAND